MVTVFVSHYLYICTCRVCIINLCFLILCRFGINGVGRRLWQVNMYINRQSVGRRLV